MARHRRFLCLPVVSVNEWQSQGTSLVEFEFRDLAENRGAQPAVFAVAMEADGFVQSVQHNGYIYFGRTLGFFTFDNCRCAGTPYPPNNWAYEKITLHLIWFLGSPLALRHWVDFFQSPALRDRVSLQTCINDCIVRLHFDNKNSISRVRETCHFTGESIHTRFRFCIPAITCPCSTTPYSPHLTIRFCQDVLPLFWNAHAGHHSSPKASLSPSLCVYST